MKSHRAIHEPEAKLSRRSPRALMIFSATLAAAAGLGTLPSFAFGVLAPFLRDEFGLARSRLGLLTTVFFVVAAPASLIAGKVVDAVGGRTVLAFTFAGTATITLGMAVAPSYRWLLAVSALAGIPLALANPVTNKLVARHVSQGARGVVMGVKQSGVQIGAFLVGAVLPAAARAWGWRTALALALAPAALGLVGTFWLPSSRRVPMADRSGIETTSGHGLKVLAAYAFLMGAGMAAIIAYLPLYAEESVGLSVTQAGAVTGTIGLMGIFSRIAWGWGSGRFSHMSFPLVIMSGGAMVATALIIAATTVGGWALWPAAVLIGGTAAAWMAVGMLAIITEVDDERAGRASGRVVFAFFAGCIASPLMFGYAVDATASYARGWLGVLMLFGLACLIAARWRRASIRSLVDGEGFG